MPARDPTAPASTTALRPQGRIRIACGRTDQDCIVLEALAEGRSTIASNRNCGGLGHALAFRRVTRSRPTCAWVRRAPGGARAVTARLGATGLSRGELALCKSARIDRGACGAARDQSKGVRRGHRRRAAPFRRPEHGRHRRAERPREDSAAKAGSRRAARVAESGCPARGLGAAALRQASRRGDGALLASRQLREPARASDGPRLRRHRGIVGPRRLARIDAPAGSARSPSPSRPAHAPAASTRASTSGAVPA